MSDLKCPQCGSTDLRTNASRRYFLEDGKWTLDYCDNDPVFNGFVYCADCGTTSRIDEEGTEISEDGKTWSLKDGYGCPYCGSTDLRANGELPGWYVWDGGDWQLDQLKDDPKFVEAHCAKCDADFCINEYGTKVWKEASGNSDTD